MKISTVQSIEEFVFRWFKKHRYNVMSLLVLFVLVQIASNLPYFNLFLTPNNVNLLLITLTCAILITQVKALILIGMGLLPIALFFEYLDRKETVEIIGGWVYVVLLVAIVKGIFSIYSRKS